MSVSFSRIKDAWAEGTGSLDMAPFDSIELCKVRISVSYSEADAEYARESMRADKRRKILENVARRGTEEGKEMGRRSSARFYRKNREEILAKTRERYAARSEEQKEKKKEYMKMYYEKNREDILRRRREAYARQKSKKDT